MSDSHEGDVEYSRLQTEAMEVDAKRRSIQDLRKSPGYQLIVAYMQQQADMLAKKVIGTPCKTIDSCMEQEYNKGVLQGLLQFEQLTESQFVMLSDELEHLREQLK